MLAGKSFRVVSLGCKVNHYEGRAMADVLVSCGMREARDGEPAEVCVANTCTVTSTADAKSRKLVRALRRANPGAVVIATGCMIEAGSEIDGADFVLPNPLKGEVARLLRREVLPEMKFVPLPSTPKGGTRCALKARTFRRARAVLKVQDGCSAACTYCVLPRVRGPERSVALDGAENELRELFSAGYKEVVIAGVHLGNYGLDLAGRRLLAELVRRAAREGLDRGARVRLSSIEAAELDDELLDAMCSPAVCPHLHLPLQSGDERVLRAMGRKYTPDGFLRKVRRVREALPAPAVTGDVIVGFPGESEKAFEATCEVVKEAGFSRLHVFPYSARPGTPAAEFPGKVPAEVSKERAARLRGLGKKLAEDFALAAVGRECELLAEDGVGGYTERYVRGRLTTRVPRGSLARGRARGVEDGVLVVEADR